MSKGRANSKQSQLRRRKGALTRRQANVDTYNRLLGSPISDEERVLATGLLETAQKEVETLKSRIGVYNG